MAAETKQDLFFVRRNTNRNEVHYAIATTGEERTLSGPAPVTGYWRMLEKGPDITEPITIFEQMAFGIASQQVNGPTVQVKLTALPDRVIDIERTKDNTGHFTAYTTMDGSKAQLTDFYVFAEAAFIMPKVKYIEIHGIKDGLPVTERIQK